MNFSTTIYFMIAFIMTFASTFGSAANVGPVRSLRGLDAIPTEETPTIRGGALRQLEVQGMDDYYGAMDEFNAGHGDRELAPDITCYTMWCLGKIRGTCYQIYPKCYPL